MTAWAPRVPTNLPFSDLWFMISLFLCFAISWWIMDELNWRQSNIEIDKLLAGSIVPASPCNIMGATSFHYLYSPKFNCECWLFYSSNKNFKWTMILLIFCVWILICILALKFLQDKHCPRLRCIWSSMFHSFFFHLSCMVSEIPSLANGIYMAVPGFCD